MKHFNLIGVLALLLLPAEGMAQFAWYAADGKAQVETGLGDDTHTQGLWWVGTDNADGGKSKVVWDVPPGEDGSLDNLVKKRGGISGTAVLDKANLDYAPMVNIGFYIVGDGEDGKGLKGDASAWNGIAISYECDTSASIELGFGQEYDRDECNYDNPYANLPKSPDGNFVRRAWTDFRQGGWGQRMQETVAEATTHLVAVKFKIQGQSGSYHFKIKSIGSYDMLENPPLAGDVNSDGSIDVADIATVINVMAGSAPEHKARADVNGDGSIDVADIATIINKMAANAR